MASLNNMNTVYANEIYMIFSTGASEIRDKFATTEYVDNEISNINVGSGGITQQDSDDATNPIIAVSDGQNFVITDINKDLANNFQTTTQLNLNCYYNKTEVDSAIAVVDTKALINSNAINAINTIIYKKTIHSLIMIITRRLKLMLIIGLIIQR